MPHLLALRSLDLGILSPDEPEIVDPATMTASEQVELFKDCSTLLSVHGAGLTNLAFIPPQSCVIELLPPLCATRSYWVTALALGHRYIPFICQDTEVQIDDYSAWKHDSKYNTRNVLVDCEKLRLLI